jgi:hypothetical protein
MRHAMNNVSRLMLAAGLLASLAATAQAQSSCSSDGAPQPVALLERFINADCEPCWRDAGTAKPHPGELALDWIVPGQRGDDAPLSAAALRDAVMRLKQLGITAPAEAGTSRLRRQSARHRLRVARGPSFNGYMGASIELKPGSGGPWSAWLLLVETLPAGAAGSPVARNLVRNAIQPAWDGQRPPSKQERQRLFESRPLSIPEGADPRRLQVVGWVQDAQGRIRAIARSRCAPNPRKG